MIRVILGCKVKDINLTQPLLLRIRLEALQQKGFVTSEILLSHDERSLVAIEITWDDFRRWKEWEKSASGQSLLQELKRYTLEEPRVTIYTRMSTGFQWIG
jgi:heme-degrading monooxygenase HmoA